jgi:S1-C subfamily serine protease
MSRFVWFAALILVMGEASQAESAQSHHDLVVYVEIDDQSSQAKARGSGVLLGMGGFIITAKHLFDDYKAPTDKIIVSIKTSSSRIPARLFGCDQYDSDLCLLYIDSANITAASVNATLNIACRFPEDQEAVTAMGWPVGSPMISVSGQVSSGALGVQFKTYMTAPIVPGMSGGPIFDAKGNMIGIAFGATEQGVLTLFTPIQFARSLLLAAGVPCSDQSK